MRSHRPPGAVAEELGARRLGLRFWLLAAGCVGAKLWLVSAQAMSALNAHYDDLHFLLEARSVAHGKWLGPYSELTLAKGPVFPLWVAAVHAAGLPLHLANQALHALAALAAVIALRPLLHRPLHSVLLFAFLLYDPVTFTSGVSTRSIREGIYPALTMLVVACAIGFVLRAKARVREMAAWAAGCGLALAAFWFTREEGVAIVPFAAIIATLAVMTIWHDRAADRPARLALVALPLLLWATAATSLSAVNRRHYGTWSIVEFKQRDFVAAYGALSRVKHAQWRATVPLPGEARARIYAVSPAFATLEADLEGEIGRAWARSSGDMEMRGGWFVWAFREAAARAGHHASAATAAVYYRTLAAEVNAACDAGRLECIGRRATLTPPWRSEYAVPLARSSASMMWHVLTVAQFDATPAPSDPNVEVERFYREMTRSPIEPANSGDGLRTVARGWAVGPSPDLKLALRSAAGRPLEAKLAYLASPDVLKQAIAGGSKAPWAGRARFTITSASRDAAWLEFLVGGRRVARVPLDGSVRSGREHEIAFQLEYVEADEGQFTRRPGRLDTIRLRVLTAIATGYRLCLPLLAALALAVFVHRGAIVARRGGAAADWIIMAALLVAIASRIFVLALIDVTSFPTRATIYLSPASTLLMVFIAVASTTLLAAAPLRPKHLRPRSP